MITIILKFFLQIMSQKFSNKKTTNLKSTKTQVKNVARQQWIQQEPRALLWLFTAHEKLIAMASIMKPIFDYYDWTLTLVDPRSKGWFLVDSPKPTFCLIVMYLTTVWLGPKIMRKWVVLMIIKYLTRSPWDNKVMSKR